MIRDWDLEIVSFHIFFFNLLTQNILINCSTGLILYWKSCRWPAKSWLDDDLSIHHSPIIESSQTKILLKWCANHWTKVSRCELVMCFQETFISQFLRRIIKWAGRERRKTFSRLKPKDVRSDWFCCLSVRFPFSTSCCLSVSISGFWWLKLH